jgi:S-formylglutathione hydrolase FrmB
MARERSRLRLAVAAATGAALVSTALVAPPAAFGSSALRKADTGAAITGQKRISAHILDLSVRSPSLRQTVKVRVITPKGWSRTAARRWPVVYAYHGGNDNYLSWTRETDIEGLAARWKALVVLPEGGTNGSYTDWFNYGKGGTPKWETFHTKEVIQLMERNYRAGSNRAAMGISSGAQGAITYAARHRGLFKYAASFSGIVHLTKPGIPAILMAEGLAFNPTQDPFRIWGKPDKNLRNWSQHDPYVLAKNLRGTGLYLSAGTTGEPGPLDPPFVGWKYVEARLVGGISESVAGSTNVSLISRLKQLKIPVTTHIYKNGWHQWGYWVLEMQRAWPLMMKAIGAKRA